MKIQAEIIKEDKAADKQMKQIEGAVAKADKAAAKAAAKEATREAKAAAKDADKAAEERKEHGVGKITGKDKKWWEKQNMAIIKLQAELRGHRFNDSETKGGTTTINGIKTKFKSLKKKTI